MKLKASSKINTEKPTENNISEASIHTFLHDNGELQRVMAVKVKSWDCQAFLRPKFNADAYKKIVHLYKNFIVPKAPFVFGQMALFYIPKDLDIPSEIRKDENEVSRSLPSAITAYLSRNVKIKKGRPFFGTPLAKVLWEELSKRDAINIVSGKLPFTKFLQVDKCLGFISSKASECAMIANASFFVMDAFDVGSFEDRIGTPLGLIVKSGIVINPPLFDREALLVKDDGTVCIDSVKLSSLTFEINGKKYLPGKNCDIFERPKTFRIPQHKGKITAVIIGDTVDSLYKSGTVTVPESGFLLVTDSRANISCGSKVTYHGMENIRFGISVGNSIIRDGIPTHEFISKFYNIKQKLGRKAFPPSLYPLDFNNARAPRMAIGAGTDNLPVILWAEGPGKTGYTKGIDSAGASLSEMAEICMTLGLTNAINLDGGGSAQIQLYGKRHLLISDRIPADNSEAERAVPIAISVP